MLADRRADALVANFAGQWLQLRNLRASIPDQNDFPDFDDNLRQAFRRETELLFRERRSRRTAACWTCSRPTTRSSTSGWRGTTGFRMSTAATSGASRDETRPRRGLLGHGQHAAAHVASRSDFAGPARQVDSRQPARHASAAGAGQRSGARGESGSRRRERVREQMEIHRKSPACASCHRVMDPLGLALENFDAVGAWRTRDAGSPIDAAVELTDGTHGRRRGGAATGVAGPARHVCEHHGRKDAHLRPWARARVLRPAGGPRGRSRRRATGLPVLGSGIGYCE